MPTSARSTPAMPMRRLPNPHQALLSLYLAMHALALRPLRRPHLATDTHNYISTPVGSRETSE